MVTQLYRRKAYLEKIHSFIGDTGIIKVVTGIPRCSKSCLMEIVAEETTEHGTSKRNIVFINPEKRGLRSVKTPNRLETAIEERLPNETDGSVYRFIDEIQRVADFEEVVNAYRADGGFSVFITGSNSYLLSNELTSDLTGRYVEIELFTLLLSEYLEIREYLGKPLAPEARLFRDFLHTGASRA